MTCSLVIECDDLWLVAELFEQSDLIDVSISNLLVNMLQVDFLQSVRLVVRLTYHLEHLNRMIHGKSLAHTDND